MAAMLVKPGIDIAVSLVFGFLDRAMQYKQLVDKAKAENRDISDAELQVLADEAQAALDKLQKTLNG